jgi:hypothetical protein
MWMSESAFRLSLDSATIARFQADIRFGRSTSSSARFLELVREFFGNFRHLLPLLMTYET